MKHCVIFVGLAAVLLASGMSYGVEPAYKGQFGNAEEPALRPYKWMLQGAKALVYQTGKSFRDGNMKTPVIGTVEVGRGLRRGIVEFSESTFKGALGAPIPARSKYFKQLNATNTVIEEDIILKNTADFLFTWWYYPVLKYNDHYPLESEDKVYMRNRRAKEIREQRAAARPQPAVGETEVKRAQQQYVSARASYGKKKHNDGRSNLLKLAK